MKRPLSTMGPWTRAVMVGALLVGFCAAGYSKGQEAPYRAPKLMGQTWFNVKSGDLDRVNDFKGRVTVLHFWTFECINCKHNLPSYAAWAKQFPPDTVQVIGVHTPELPEERSVENVRKAIAKLGIEYPVLIDNNGRNWARYGLEAWPTVFLIDKRGRVRRSWVGELGYQGADGFQQLTKTIQDLIKE